MKKKILNKIKNLLTFDRALQFPQTIVAICIICGGVFAVILYLWHAFRDFLLTPIYNIYRLEVWSIPIILKLWQVIFLLLLSISAYLYPKKLIKKYKFKKSLIEYQNYKWRIAKNIFDRYCIDLFPYCIEHNKQIIQTSTVGLKCPDCDIRYSWSNIEELFPDIQLYIKDKIKLSYLPEINCSYFNHSRDDHLKNSIELLELRIKKLETND